jgi:hypothetical protein
LVSIHQLNSPIKIKSIPAQSNTKELVQSFLLMGKALSQINAMAINANP